MEGFYFDPKHGGCLRRIWRVGTGVFRVGGVYGDDERQTGNYWFATASVAGVADARGRVPLTVDFSRGKPCKTRTVYAAHWSPVRRRIRWDDGNAWVKLYVHPRQLLGALP